MKTTTRYRSTNASLSEQAERRKALKQWMKSPIAKGINGEPPFAVAYGVADGNGIVKLFKKCPVFYSSGNFDKYIKRHKQIVQAVYSCI